MELRHLRYFVCVAEEQNLSRAAKRLHISQPPLTRQIKALEEDLGTVLFERTRRGMVLTDAGRVFLVEAERVLNLVDQARARTRRAGAGAAGRVDIALFGTAIFGAIPQLLRAYRDAMPDVEVVLHNMAKLEQLDALEQRRIDLAFNRLMRPAPGITSEVLLTEALFVAMAEDHPLVDRGALTLADLAEEPMVLFPTGYRPSFIDRVVELCRRVGFDPEVSAEVADVVHGIALVASGHSVCLVPHSATNVRVPGVRYRALADVPQLRVDLCCVYRRGEDSPVLDGLLASMRATAPAVEALREAEIRRELAGSAAG